MRSTLSALALTAMLAGATPLWADEPVNAVVVAAIRAWEAAAAQPDSAAGQAERLRLLSQVDDRVETILTQFASSDVALQLILGEAIGPITRAGLAQALEEAEGAVSGAADDAGARALFVQASLLLEEADAIAVDSQEDALVFALTLQSANAMIGRIETDHGAAQLARDLASGAPMGRASPSYLAELARRGRGHLRRYCDGDSLQTCLFATAQGQMEEIEDPRDRLRASRTIAGMLARAGDDAAARALFRQAYALMDAMDTGIGQSSTLAGLLRAEIHAGFLEDAESHNARYLSLLRDPETLDMTLIGEDLAAGDALSAIDRARGLQDARNRANALLQIAEAQAEAGDRQGASDSLQAALGAARAGEDDGARNRAIGRIAVAMAHHASLHEAERAAGGITDPVDRARAMTRIAAVAEDQGAADTAREILAEALAAAEAIEDGYLQATALIRIAELDRDLGAATMTHVARIRAALEAMEPGRSRDNAQERLAEYLAEQGAFDAVRRLYPDYETMPASLRRNLAAALALHDEGEEVRALIGYEGDVDARDRMRMAVIDALWDAPGRRDEAAAMVGLLETPAQLARGLIRMADLMMEEESAGEARRFLQEALEQAGAVPGDRANLGGFSFDTDQSYILGLVAGGCLDAGFLADAYRAARAIPDPTERAFALARIAAAAQS